MLSARPAIDEADGRDPAAISFEDVVKRYRDVVALDHVSFSLPFGKCLGLVGPNGAGKTTTFRILAGLIRRFSGEARVAGHSVRDDRPAIGAIIESPGFYPYLTVAGNLNYFAAFAGVSRPSVGDVVRLAGLQEVASRKAGVLSHGMRQRLGLGLALLTGSKLLLLDEPMTGLDPAAQREMRDVLRQRLNAGAAVLISTHNLAEVEALADILVFLKGGRVLASGFTTDFLRGGTISIEIGEAQMARRVLEAAGYQILSAQRTEVVLRKDANAEGEKIARVLAEAGLYPRSIQARRGSLEDVYLQVMEGDAGT